MSNCSICNVQLDQPGMIETRGSCGTCTGCDAQLGDAAAARELLVEIKRLRAALGVALHHDEVIGEALRASADLCSYALPKFNWGASALDARAIRLLNETPPKIAQALKGL